MWINDSKISHDVERLYLGKKKNEEKRLKITYKKINEPRTVSEREENAQINKTTPNTKNIVIEEENSEKRRKKNFLEHLRNPKLIIYI